MRIPTVRIKDGYDGFYTINAVDFDPASHELFEEGAKETEGNQEAEEAPKTEDAPEAPKSKGKKRGKKGAKNSEGADSGN